MCELLQILKEEFYSIEVENLSRFQRNIDATS